MRKINLGSGPRSALGWINYDWGLLPFLGKYRFTSILVKTKILSDSYNWLWPKLELVDIRKTLPDEDESVDYIYCSHVLEHFEKDEAIKILKECRRVLKNKGILRIVLPDLKKIIKYYENGDKFNREYFGFDKDLYNGFLGRIKRLFIRGHQWMYDAESAKNILKEAGFNKIIECSFRKGKTPNINVLDLEQHKKISFYLEAENNFEK